MSESGGSNGERAERMASELAHCLSENAHIFHINGGTLIDLLKDLVSEKIRKDAFKSAYAAAIDAEVPLPDDVLNQIWDLRRYLRDGPPKSNFFVFLGVRRVLTLEQAAVMKAESMEMVKEEPEDPGYPEGRPEQASPATRKRRIAKETWTCACQRKFHAYVPLVVHAATCNRIDRLPQVDELPSGFLSKMRSPTVSARDLVEAWNSLIPAPPADTTILPPPTPSVPQPGASSAQQLPPPPHSAVQAQPMFPQTPYAQRPAFGPQTSGPTTGQFGQSGPFFQQPAPPPPPFQGPPNFNFMPPGSVQSRSRDQKIRRDVEMLGVKVDQSMIKINTLEKKLLDLENLVYRTSIQLLDKMEEMKANMNRQ